MKDNDKKDKKSGRRKDKKTGGPGPAPRRQRTAGVTGEPIRARFGAKGRRGRASAAELSANLEQKASGEAAGDKEKKHKKRRRRRKKKHKNSESSEVDSEEFWQDMAAEEAVFQAGADGSDGPPPEAPAGQALPDMGCTGLGAAVAGDPPTNSSNGDSDDSSSSDPSRSPSKSGCAAASGPTQRADPVSTPVHDQLLEKVKVLICEVGKETSEDTPPTSVHIKHRAQRDGVAFA